MKRFELFSKRTNHNQVVYGVNKEMKTTLATPMTKRTFLGLLAMAGAGLTGAFGLAPKATAAPAGTIAPAFSLKDTNGHARSLKDFKGRYVVLEWTNHDCPFVKAQYESGSMQKTQRWAKQQGVVWLSIASSAKGNEGYHDGAETNAWTKSHKAAPTAVLLDADGKVGRLYKAKTTPHMFVISPQGKVIYNGAISDRATTDKGEVPGASNYVIAALTQAKKGQKVAVATTQPFGCSVKY